MMSQELSDKEIKNAFDKLKITPETESSIKENSDTSIPNPNRKTFKMSNKFLNPHRKRKH